MNAIKELYHVSNYRPKKGAKLALFRLMINEGYSKEEAKKVFEVSNSFSQFRSVYKALKDHQLVGVMSHNFHNLPKDKKIKFAIWRKHLQSKMLINAHKREIGVKMAIETIKMAEKSSELEIVQSLCNEQ